MIEKKSKRKLSNIDFSSEGAHLALVGPAVGGPANGKDYALIMKSNFSPEFIQKASMITVTLEITEFLQKFFYVYGSDAEVLARTLGFTTAMQDDIASESKDEYENSYETYIQDKVQSFTVMKSLYESDNFITELGKLKEDQYLNLLQDQSTLEKAFNSISKEIDKEVKTVQKDSNKTSTVLKQIEKSKKEYKMEIEKALEEQKALLKKALEEVEIYKAKEKEAITKARFNALKDAVKDEDKAQVLFKALSLVQDQDEFTSVVKTLAEMTSVVQKSELFVEKGVLVKEDTPVVKESAVAKAVKAQINK